MLQQTMKTKLNPQNVNVERVLNLVNAIKCGEVMSLGVKAAKFKAEPERDMGYSWLDLSRAEKDDVRLLSNYMLEIDLWFREGVITKGILDTNTCQHVSLCKATICVLVSDIGYVTKDCNREYWEAT